jgi:hypothetical protein
MFFARSLLGGLPGKASFRAVATSFLEVTPNKTLSLFPLGLGRRFQSTEADPKDLVRSLFFCADNKYILIFNRNVLTNFVILVFQHTSILVKQHVQNVFFTILAVSKKSMMSVGVMVLVQRWTLWI